MPICFPARAAALLAAAIAATASADIIIEGYSPSTNDRFTGDPAFIMEGFDLSGVAQATNGFWATALGRTTLITAYHARPTGTLYFYPDDGSPPVTRPAPPFIRVPDTDLALGALAEPLPSNIASYPYATEPIAGGPIDNIAGPGLSPAGLYQGLPAYLFGRSPEPRDVFADQAVGRNAVAGIAENVAVFGGVNNLDALMFTREQPGVPGHLPYESYLQPGDSGGPAFVEIDSALRLIGTNSFIGTGDGISFPDFSGINYTGNQAAFIASFLAANETTICSPADVTSTGATLAGQPGFGEPDNTVDLDDLGYFLNAWVAGDASIADTTTTGATLEGQPGFGAPDSFVDLDDLGYFLNFWLTGCP